MSRIWVGILTVLVALSCITVVNAKEAILPQVVYEFEVYELANQEEHQLLLEAVSLMDTKQLTSFGLEVFKEQHAISILGQTAMVLREITNGKKTQRMATPALMVALGRTATLRVIEEEIVPERSAENLHLHTVGLEFQVLPVQVAQDGQFIFSVFDITTYDPTTSVHTEVWLASNEAVPLAAVELAGARLFAVFVRASLAEHLPDQSARSVGGLGGLGDLFWPEDQPAPTRGNSLWLAMPLNPIALPEGGATLWIGSDLYVDGEMREASYPYSHLGLGVLITDEGPNLELRWIHGTEGNYVALGLTDQVEVAPGIILSAGYLPGVFELTDFQRHKAHWWVKLEARPDPFRIAVCYQSDGKQDIVRTELGYQVTKHTAIVAGVSMNKDRGNRLSAGAQFKF